MVVTPVGIFTDARPTQPAKALVPMLVTLSGIIIEVSSLQPLKASSSMLVILSGIMTETREAPAKAFLLIPTTVFPLYVEGIMIAVSVHEPILII